MNPKSDNHSIDSFHSPINHKSKQSHTMRTSMVLNSTNVTQNIFQEICDMSGGAGANTNLHSSNIHS